MKIHSVDVAIIGAGTAGMYALREVRRAGRSFALIDHGPLGTVCARVGCMPSKVALHAGGQWRAVQNLGRIGGRGMELLSCDRQATWESLRDQRDGFADPAAARAREAAGPHLIEGRARFLSESRLSVELNGGGECKVQANAVIIATGSRPILPAWLDDVRERVVTTDDLFELETLPDAMGVLGLGVIGLEMGLALARLGIKVTGADVAGSIGGMPDPEVAARAIQRLGTEFEMWLQANTRLSLTDSGILMEADGNRYSEVGLLIAALGRRSNVDKLGLEKAGFDVDRNGIPPFDPRTMQVTGKSIFIAGDANNSVPLMHEAVDEGLIAGFNAARMTEDKSRQPQAFIRKTPLSIAFTDPDLAIVGARFSELDGKEIVVGSVEGQRNGRSRVMHEPESLLRVYADRRMAVCWARP